MWVHWVDWFGPLATAAYFALLAAAGMLLALASFSTASPAVGAAHADER